MKPFFSDAMLPVVDTTTMKKPKIAVIGGGWSGIAAATVLAKKADTVLFEAGRKLGGRARRSDGLNDDDFSFTDNGQHILLYAYDSVRRLLALLGVNEQKAFHRVPLQWYMHDGLQFHAAPFPAPFHLIVGVLRAKNISFRHKIQLVMDMADLRSHIPSAEMSVAEWLHQRQIPRLLLRDFWQPLVWGALNTPLAEASLLQLYYVLQDGVWAKRDAGDYCIPKTDLSTLFVEPAQSWLLQHKVRIETQKRIGQLAFLPNGKVLVGDEAFDGVVVAVAPYHVLSLLPAGVPNSLVEVYNSLTYHEITTVYLRYADSVYLPAAMTGLVEGTAQWLIGRAGLNGAASEVAAVISCADEVAAKQGIHCAEDWIQRVHQDIQRICPYVESPISARVFTEKRATTSGGQAILVHQSWLHHHRIFLAGDYLHPCYPATLEAAVQSGQMAASLCLNTLFEQGKIL